MRARRDRFLACLALTLLLLLSLGLKLLRYGPAGDGHAAAEARVERALAARGYAWQATRPLTGHGTTRALLFAAPACPDLVAVVVLGDDGAAAEAIRRAFAGGPAAFLLDGRTHDRLPLLRFQLSRLLGGAASALGFAGSEPLPILAVSPAPGTSPCLPAGAAAWLAAPAI